LGNIFQIRQNIAHELENWVALQDATAPEPPQRPAERPRAAVARSQPAEPRWRISPILDELKRRKTLTVEEHAAACRFLREYYLGLIAVIGPRTQRYERSSASANGYDPVAEKIHYAKETERAIMTIDPMYYPALKWLVGTLGEGRPLSSLGEDYAPGLGAQTQSARCGAAVALLCACLCRHYGIQHRLTVEQRIESLSRVLLESRPEK
jgi:hypothetical protein